MVLRPKSVGSAHSLRTQGTGTEAAPEPPDTDSTDYRALSVAIRVYLCLPSGGRSTSAALRHANRWHHATVDRRLWAAA